MRGNMGRPSSARHATVVVRRDDTGQAVAWSDGEFAGDAALVRDARVLAEQQAEVDLGGHVRTANATTPEGAAVAMLAACRGRGIVVSPEDLVFSEDRGCHNDTPPLAGDDV